MRYTPALKDGALRKVSVEPAEAKEPEEQLQKTSSNRRFPRIIGAHIIRYRRYGPAPRARESLCGQGAPTIHLQLGVALRALNVKRHSRIVEVSRLTLPPIR